MDSRSKALYIARAAQDKKAHDIVILDMRNISDVADYFVICSGTSTRQVKAISDHVIGELESSGQRIGHTEGYHHALWILLDCADVIVHVFQNTVREFYNLERLWGDAPTLSLEGNGKKKGKAYKTGIGA